MFLPLLRGQRLALERLNVRLLVRVEDFDAADEFLEVVEEVGALVVCRGFRIVSGREREGCFRLSIEELPWTYKRRWSRTRPGPRQTRKGCLRRNNLDSENKERESPKKKKTTRMRQMRLTQPLRLAHPVLVEPFQVVRHGLVPLDVLKVARGRSVQLERDESFGVSGPTFVEPERRPAVARDVVTLRV